MAPFKQDEVSMYHLGRFPFLGGWLIGMVVLAAFVILIAWGVALIVRRADRRAGASIAPAPPTPPPASDPAVQILRERFARGEIDEAEFLSTSRALAAAIPGPASPNLPVQPPS